MIRWSVVAVVALAFGACNSVERDCAAEAARWFPGERVRMVTDRNSAVLLRGEGASLRAYSCDNRDTWDLVLSPAGIADVDTAPRKVPPPPPVSKRAAQCERELDGALANLKVCVGKQKDCVAARNEQQELRFWKRCGVIRLDDHDQWAECNGMESAADAACSPMYNREIDPDWCDGRTKELWDRMQRDGVTWINCKEGTVCP